MGSHRLDKVIDGAIDAAIITSGTAAGAVTRPHLRACWLLVDDAVLEARERADTAFYQGCTDVERFIRHYMARSP